MQSEHIVPLQCAHVYVCVEMCLGDLSLVQQPCDHKPQCLLHVSICQVFHPPGLGHAKYVSVNQICE